MISILLAAVSGLITAVCMTLILRTAPRRAHLRALVCLFAIILAGLCVAALSVPLDSGFLSTDLTEPDRYHCLFFAAFLYSAGFWGGLLQLYNLADRGLSLRVLIDLYESPSKTRTLPQLASAYAGGLGLGWMFEKRLNGMASAGLIERHNGYAVITPRGRRLAHLFTGAQTVLGHVESDTISEGPLV